MDRRSWLWRRKSSEKGLGETESSGSASSHSERYSDDQEALRASPNSASPNHAQSPEVSSHVASSDVHETVKSLSEKLSAALLNISAKEDLVKQHMKVTEEAVSGWEKAETELAAVKQQLEAASLKNSSLEDRIGHLDEALKESVRQLRHSREEQEQKVHDALMKKTREWESDKFELENRLIEFQVQLEAAKAEAAIFLDHDLRSKLEAAENENIALKVELLARSEDLQTRTLEKELSTRAAETASKQHLESIKKVAKFEAECRMLRAVVRRTSSANDHKPTTNSVYVDSLTDSQSDSGERLFCDNEPSCSDSWASALIAELDQFKNEKASVRKLATSSEIDLMDDFLEMERLVAMPETDRGISSFKLEAECNSVLPRDSPLKSELETVRRQMAELEEKLEKMETEKAELEMALDDTRNRLELSSNQLIVAEDKLVLLQGHLDSANETKQVAMTEVVSVEENGKALESQLESVQLEVRKLCEKVCILEGKVEKEKALSAEFEAKVEAVEATRKALQCQLESANCEVKELREKVCTLEGKLEKEKAVSTEFASKVEAVEGTRKDLESQLESANFEVQKLREKMDKLEGKVEQERTVSAEFAAKVKSGEETRKALECQLESAGLEVGKLHEKVALLEDKVEEERSLSAEFATEVEASEAARKALETRLQSSHMEVGKLLDKVALLEEKIEEKALSTPLEANFENLEDDLSRKKREAELQRVTNSNRELKIKQEKELFIAAGKLAECQKTIASLGQQLKSLTSLDDFMLEDEKPEHNGGPPDHRNGDVKKLHTSNSLDTIVDSALPNGKARGPRHPSSSPSSSFSGFQRLMSQSREQ